jgi:2Fe-2S ferredoxin
MPKITFVSHDGNPQDVNVTSGTTVMQAAIDNGIDSIVAECGGACSCATCHVYVDDAWAQKVPAVGDVEKDMIECVLEPQENSRLSCQVVVDDSLDGLVVRLPEKQF